jgi:hypothetical protein
MFAVRFSVLKSPDEKEQERAIGQLSNCWIVMKRREDSLYFSEWTSRIRTYSPDDGRIIIKFRKWAPSRHLAGEQMILPIHKECLPSP